MADVKDGLTGRDKANHLVASFGKWLGVYDAELDTNNDRSFGTVGFHYHPKRDTLEGRVHIEDAWLPNAKEESKNNFRKVAKALNDPAIGGMFERARGKFVLDEEKRMFFLVRRFKVAETTPRQLRIKMTKLMNVGATWTLHWFGRVARITHGFEPPPAEPVPWPAGGSAQGKEG
jgi:hypothetical protein